MNQRWSNVALLRGKMLKLRATLWEWRSLQAWLWLCVCIMCMSVHVCYVVGRIRDDLLTQGLIMLEGDLFSFNLNSPLLEAKCLQYHILSLSSFQRFISKMECIHHILTRCPFYSHCGPMAFDWKWILCNLTMLDCMLVWNVKHEG